MAVLAMDLQWLAQIGIAQITATSHITFMRNQVTEMYTDSKIVGNKLISIALNDVVASATKTHDGKYVWSSLLGRAGHKRNITSDDALIAAARHLGFTIING